MKNDVVFPKEKKISDDAKDLITKLLIKSPDKRLGSKKGLYEIIKHSFFKGYEIEKIMNKSVILIYY